MFDIDIFGVSVNVPAQVCGLLGLLVILAAYQMTKTKLIIFQFAGYCFCLAEALFAFAWIGAVVTFAAMIRNVLMIICRYRFGRELPLWITIIVLGVMWAGCLPFYVTGVSAHWLDYLPPTLVMISSICAVNKNFYVLKAGALVHESAYIFYHAGVGAYIGIVRQIVLSVGIIVSIVRMILLDRKAKSAGMDVYAGKENFE